MFNGHKNLDNVTGIGVTTFTETDTELSSVMQHLMERLPLVVQQEQMVNI